MKNINRSSQKKNTLQTKFSMLCMLVAMLVSGWNSLNAQGLHLNIISPSMQSPYLADLYNQRDLFSIQITNSGAKSVKVKIDGTLTYDGNVIVSSPWSKSRIIQIEPGLNVFPIEDVISLRAVQYSNFVTTAITAGMIRAGNYEACIRLMDAYSGKEVMPNSCKSSMITSFQAPTLLMPFDEKEVKASSYPLFKWTAVSPAYKSPLMYNVRVFEILKGQNKLMAIQSNRPLVDEYTMALQMIWPFSIPLGSGNYVWTVRAINTDGKAVGEPNSYAQPFTFKVIRGNGNGNGNGLSAGMSDSAFFYEPTMLPIKQLIVLNSSGKNRDTAANVKMIPMEDYLLENGYYPNKNLIETIQFLNRDYFMNHSSISPDSLIIPDKLEVDKINRDYKVGLKKYNRERSDKTQVLFERYILSQAAFERNMDKIKTGSGLPDSIQTLGAKVSQKLNRLKFENIDRQDIDLIYDFTNGFNELMKSAKQPFDQNLLNNMNDLLKDFNLLLDIIKVSIKGTTGYVALPDNLSCDLSSTLYISELNSENSADRIPIKLFALDDKKNVLKGIEVYFIAHGLASALPPDYFVKGSKDVTTCFKFLHRMRYHVYLIDSRTRGKIASREIDLSECKKEIEYYQKMGQNAITRYITIDSHKISQFLKASTASK